MTTISGQKWTSGIALIGTNGNTAFASQLKGSYSMSAPKVCDRSGPGNFCPLEPTVPRKISCRQVEGVYKKSGP
jgi:hypothetical protein